MRAFLKGKTVVRSTRTENLGIAQDAAKKFYGELLVKSMTDQPLTHSQANFKEVCGALLEEDRSRVALKQRRQSMVDRSFSEFIDTLKKSKQLKERNDVLVEQANAEYKASHNANLAYQAAQDREAARVNNALSSISQSLNSIAEAQRNQATSPGNAADEIGRQSSQYEMERAAQQAQEEKASRDARISQHGPRIAPSAPQRVDLLSKAPEPSQTVESRRAAGLPDDPNAAKCIQDDDCARSLLQAAPKQ